MFAQSVVLSVSAVMHTELVVAQRVVCLFLGDQLVLPYSSVVGDCSVCT